MAFCIAIHEQLPTKTCPLPQGACYWQHRKTNNCKYTHDDLSIEQFCSLVGLPQPSPDYVKIKLEELRKKLKS